MKSFLLKVPDPSVNGAVANGFFTRRNIRRYSDHPILESETDFHVQENPLKITAPGNNLGSYLLHKGDILIVR